MILGTRGSRNCKIIIFAAIIIFEQYHITKTVHKKVSTPGVSRVVDQRTILELCFPTQNLFCGLSGLLGVVGNIRIN